jgi:PAS domain-containing protein
MKKLNEFLISNEKHFHDISENAPDLICVFDKNLEIKYINPSFKEFYNVTDDVNMLSDYLPFARRNNFITFLTEINDTKRSSIHSQDFRSYAYPNFRSRRL